MLFAALQGFTHSLPVAGQMAIPWCSHPVGGPGEAAGASKMSRAWSALIPAANIAVTSASAASDVVPDNEDKLTFVYELFALLSDMASYILRYRLITC